MKTKPNEPAFPISSSATQAARYGVSVREHFAAVAMQGLLASDIPSTLLSGDCKAHEVAPHIAAMAVECADALIAKLNE